MRDMRKHRLTIVVLCYGTSEVDIVSAPKELVDKYGDVDGFLRDYCQYDLNDISWLYNTNALNEDLPNGGISVNYLTEDSFED